MKNKIYNVRIKIKVNKQNQISLPRKDFLVMIFDQKEVREIAMYVSGVGHSRPRERRAEIWRRVLSGCLRLIGELGTQMLGVGVIQQDCAGFNPYFTSEFLTAQNSKYLKEKIQLNSESQSGDDLSPCTCERKKYKLS